MWTKRLILYVALFTLLSGPVRAQKNNAVKIALIVDKAFDLHKSPLVSLLEVRLSEEPRVALLERTQIEKILEERTLQLAFEAEGAEARRRLGGLLRARVLVILRAREEQVEEDKRVRSLKLVIADSSTGLRLVTETLVWNEAKPDETAHQIVAYVRRGCAKLAEDIWAVVAIPLFVCEDFTFHYASLKNVYPEVIRQSLESLPGVQVVEVEEAHAIAKELGLTGGGSIRRPLQPHFIQGRYRNEGEDNQRRVKVTIQLKQGEQVRAEKASAELVPESVAGFLRAGVASLLYKTLSVQAPPFDAAQEVEQFKRRASEYEKLQEHEQAFKLIQAALLIQPEPSLYDCAIRLCTEFVNSAHRERGGGDSFETRAFKAAAANLIGIDYAEHLMRTPSFDLESKEKRQLLKSFFRCGYGIYNPLEDSHDWELRRVVESVGLKKREIILSCLEYLQGREELTPPMLEIGLFVQSTCFPMSGGSGIRESYAEHLDAMFRLIRILNTVPATAGHIFFVVSYQRSQGEGTEEDARAMHHFLDRVASLPGPSPKVIAAYFRTLETTMAPEERLQKLDSLIHYVRDSGQAELDKSLLGRLVYQRKRIDGSVFRKVAPPQEPPVAEIRYGYVEEITRAFPDFPHNGRAECSFLAHNVGGVLACNNGTDLYWVCQNDASMKPPQILAMRTKGKLEHLYTANKPHTKPRIHAPITSLVYDGKYAWAAQAETLLIIDSETGLIGTVTQDDGLLPGTMKVAPIAPGFVCVVGYFGRTWCANVRYDESGRKSVDVFHRAALPEGDALDPLVAFEPEVVVSLYGASEPERRFVLVTRGKSRSWYPLLLEPVVRGVRVPPVSISLVSRHSYALHKGAFYWCDQPEIDDDDFKMSVCRLAPPDFEKEVIVRKHQYQGSDFVIPLILFDAERCFIIDEFNYLVDLEGRTVSPVAGKRNPNFHAWYRADDKLFVHTNHYGLIYLGWWDPYQPFMRVSFHKPAPGGTRLTFADADTKNKKPVGAEISSEEPLDEAGMTEVARSMIEAEITRAAKLAERPAEQKIPDNPNVRTIGGRYQVKEYFRTFAFEDGAASLLDAAQAGVQDMDAPYAHLNQAEILQGGYFPLGTFEVTNPSPKYGAITVTPASPERLVFRLVTSAGGGNSG